MASKLKQYRSQLTVAQIAAGMTSAAQNAKRLAEDAKLLFEAARFPSALSLALLSLEESGKCSILRRMATVMDDRELASLWKRYRHHTSKHTLTMMPDRIADGARRAIEFRDCVDDTTGVDERERYDALKQLGFYTDCLGNGHWSVPDEVISRDVAEIFVRSAAMAAASSKVTTPREMELWVMHMQAGITRANLIAWATSMVAEGLQPEGYAERMREFTSGLM